jgi:hypothetical protein
MTGYLDSAYSQSILIYNITWGIVHRVSKLKRRAWREYWFIPNSILWTNNRQIEMDMDFSPYHKAGIIPQNTTERRRSKCGSFASSSKRI